MKNYRWLYLTILGMVMCLISFGLRYMRKKKQNQVQEVDIEQKDNENFSSKELVLRFPEFYRGVALVVLLFFVSMSILIIMPVVLGKAEVLELMWLVPLWMIILPIGGCYICWSLWKVVAGKDGFRYRNFFGKVREYKFVDLEYKMADSCLKSWFLKDGKKVICLAYYIEGENRLLRRYNKYMSKLRAEQRKSKAR